MAKLPARWVSVLVAAILLALTLAPSAGAAASTARPGAQGATGSIAPPTGSVPTSPAASLRPSGSPAEAAVCEELRSRFASLYDGPALPPSVAWAAQADGCPIGYDEAGLGLLSDAPLAGARTSLSIALPGASAGASEALEAYEIGTWVTGVPCSAGGASYLSVDLIPPYGGSTPTNTSNWTLWAPVWDLAPAGGCDPTCENQTALFALNGSARSFCEDDAVIRGPAAGTAPLGSLPAGSDVNVTFVGAAGGSSPLALYVNDSSAAGPITVSYAANETIARAALEPLSNGSTAGSGAFWGLGPQLSVRALLCPTAAPGIAGGACDSYDGPAVNASALPRLLGADSWNASDGRYDLPYGEVLPFSSSNACVGDAAPCASFGTGGGTGNYPFYSLGGADGSSFWNFGGASEAALDPFGGPSQFAPGSGAFAAIGVDPGAASSSVAGLRATARVTSATPISAVALNVYFCSSGATPTVTTAAATESAGSSNGSTDGNFSVFVPFSHSENGAAQYWWTATSSVGATVQSQAVTLGVNGGTRTCTDAPPSTPWFGPSNVTSIGGGYRITLEENDSAVTNFTLTLAPRAGGPNLTRDLTGQGPWNVLTGSGGLAWNLSVEAFDVVGHLSSPTAVVEASDTLAPLTAAIHTSAERPLWLGSASPWVNISISGGLAPYDLRVDLGNGSTLSWSGSLPYWNLTGPAISLDGVAFVTASVSDASGEVESAAPVGISILAGPLGVNQSLSAGALDVRLSWTAPASPAGPVTGYTVYYTNRSSDAGTLTDLWSLNRTAEGSFLWNTTLNSFDVPNIPTGTTYWMLVVAWNDEGIGMLPSGWLKAPSATTANLTATPLTLTPVGGPAPLTVSASCEVSLGTNGTLTEALYSFGTEGSTAANLSSNLSGVMAFWWLNATWTFESSGPEAVEIHVTDNYSDTVIPVGYVYVGPGSPPSALARVEGGPAIIGQPVSFEGVGSGGSGHYAYNWSFGDGGNSTDATPAHTYYSAGNYTAILEVTDTSDGLDAFASVNLTVFAPPTAAIEVSSVAGSSYNYTFTAILTGGVGGLTYSWTFGDGEVGLGRSVVHNYTGSGVFVVNLTVTDSLHETTTAHVTVVIPSLASSSASTSSGLTGPELAAYVLLASLVVILLIALAYFAGRRMIGPPSEATSPPVVRRPPPGAS